jgi:nitrogen regulatory protein PII
MKGDLMKLVMIIVDSECKEELEVLLKHRQVAGYTEISSAHGVGSTGIRMGSSAFPKTSSLFMTVVPNQHVRTLTDEITSYCEACKKRMKIFAWDVEEVV